MGHINKVFSREECLFHLSPTIEMAQVKCRDSCFCSGARQAPELRRREPDVKFS